jgi:dual specificity tyrosine-phosphorylation-regulated kinase 1
VNFIVVSAFFQGSFGQVVCAYDQVNKCEVAIKIIKSRKPFLIQARTEIEILAKILERDPLDEKHIVRMIDQFIYRNHQCLVFEILSFNLYELLRNTK